MATATTTFLSASPPGGTLNTLITLTATVTAADRTIPTGSVQFKEGGTNLGSPVPLDGGGQAQTSVTPTRGSHTYTANFQATAPYANSSGQTTFFISAGFNAGKVILNPSNPTQILAARPGRTQLVVWSQGAIVNSDFTSTQVDGCLVTYEPVQFPGYDGALYGIVPGVAHGFPRGIGVNPTYCFFTEVFG